MAMCAGLEYSWSRRDRELREQPWRPLVAVATHRRFRATARSSVFPHATPRTLIHIRLQQQRQQVRLLVPTRILDTHLFLLSSL
jgi:hypothetical protein